MKRRTGVLGIVLILVLFASGAYVALRLMLGSPPSIAVGGRIAVLPISGIIESEREFVSRLERYAEDGSVRGFLLEIRSPGGGAAASQAMFSALRDFRERDDRPVVAWIGAVGASGGYYAALPADSILALPSSITGSIGVIMKLPNAGELLRRWGVEVEVIKSGESKELGSLARSLTETERQVLQTLIDDTYGQFVDAVAESRPLSRDSVLVLADGRVYSGSRAVGVGLIDATGTREDALAVAGRMAGLGDTPRTVRPVKRSLTFWEWLLDSHGPGWLDRLGLSVGSPEGLSAVLRYEWQ
ncbi:MAG: signal peptide peptidase SppA [Gemmatimonadota bacterium]|nr:signal peptide peptidase SppA [Gemmatimonadota bacterium]